MSESNKHSETGENTESVVGFGQTDLSTKINGAIKSVSSYFGIMQQYVAEKAGKRVPLSMDKEISDIIKSVEETTNRHLLLLYAIRDMAEHIKRFSQGNSDISNILNEVYSQEHPTNSDLLNELTVTSHILLQNNECTSIFLGILAKIVDSMDVLCNFSMKDSSATAKNFQMSRLKYDALKNTINAQAHLLVPGNPKSISLEESLLLAKKDYDKSRNELIVKFDYLQAHKTTLQLNNLRLFRSAYSAYFSSNPDALRLVLTQIPGK